MADEHDPPPDEAPFQNTTDEPSWEDDYPWEEEDVPPFVNEEDEEDVPPSVEEEDVPPSVEEEDEPSFVEEEDEPSSEDDSGQVVPVCAPEWRQEWYPDWASGWWWFYWFQDCYTDQHGWYRVYDGWDWGPSIW